MKRLRTAHLFLSTAALFAMTACTTPATPAAGGASLPLEGTHCRLASLDGQPVPTPPGVREGGFGKLYLAYLRDPAGNKVCAMYRMPA